jgi:hypothetical protein
MASERACPLRGATRIAFIVIALFLVGILHFIGVRVLLNPLVERETLDRGLLLAAASGLVYCTILIFTGLFLNISSTQLLVRAKASGSIESLLAAPVVVRDLWFSLSVASILPGIVTGWIGGFVSAIVYELLYLAPQGMTLASFGSSSTVSFCCPRCKPRSPFSSTWSGSRRGRHQEP